MCGCVKKGRESVSASVQVSTVRNRNEVFECPRFKNWN